VIAWRRTAIRLAALRPLPRVMPPRSRATLPPQHAMWQPSYASAGGARSGAICRLAGAGRRERKSAAADREQAARDRAAAQIDRETLLAQLAAAQSAAELLMPGSGAAQRKDTSGGGADQVLEGWRELFWRVFGVSQSPMMLLDQDRRIVALNRALTEALGYSREQMLRSRLDTFYDQAEWEFLDASWRTFQRQGSFNGDRVMVNADGDRLKVQYAAHWAHVAGRSLALFVALSNTARPHAVRTLNLQTGETLSPRELEVLAWVALGRRAHEIAVELEIAPTTVESHVRTAMRKVGARSQAQLVAIACARGLLDPAGHPRRSGRRRRAGVCNPAYCQIP
jgi:LuxR family transcriptional regulator of spore coat protein